MPAFNSPIPRAGYANYHESSPLRDKRDPDATGKLWLKVNALKEQVQQSNNSLSQTNRVVQNLGRRILGMAPNNPTVTPTYQPFEIYKPDLTQLAPFGYALVFNFPVDTDPVPCYIDNTVPTDLPFTINTATDGWRIWAVRDGTISYRDYLSVEFYEQLGLVDNDPMLINVPLADYSNTITPQFDSGTDQQGTNYNAPNQTGNGGLFGGIIPVILTGTPDSLGYYSFALFLLSGDGEYGADYFLQGVQFDSATPDDPFPTPLDLGDPVGAYQVSPIGIISTISPTNPQYVPTNLTAFQIQFGNIFPAYGTFNNNLGNSVHETGLPLAYSAPLKYRGDWNNDFELEDSVFYPGDVVKAETSIAFSASGGITVTLTDELANTGSNLFASELWMMTSVGFTSNPSTDPNWVKVSGISAITNTGKTPNT